MFQRHIKQLRVSVKQKFGATINGMSKYGRVLRRLHASSRFLYYLHVVTAGSFVYSIRVKAKGFVDALLFILLLLLSLTLLLQK